MTIELRTRHWLLVLVLVILQLSGLSISLSRSPYGPAIAGFFRRGGWFGLALLASLIFSSAFTAMVVITALLHVVSKRN